MIESVRTLHGKCREDPTDEMGPCRYSCGMGDDFIELWVVGKGVEQRRGCLRPGSRGGIEFQVRTSDRIVASFRHETQGPVLEFAEEIRQTYLPDGWTEAVARLH